MHLLILLLHHFPSVSAMCWPQPLQYSSRTSFCGVCYVCAARVIFQSARISSPNFHPQLITSHYLVSGFVSVLSGTGGFARTHAHYELRAKLKTQFPVCLKRACLLCARKMSPFSVEYPHPLDSEWHMVFECSASQEPRNAYRSIVNAGFSSLLLPWDPSPESLVTHILRAREFPDLLQHLMKCVVDSFSLRKKACNRLSVARIRAEFCSA